MFSYVNIVFILLVIAFAYLALPQRVRWIWLLGTGIAAYALFAQGYAALLLFVGSINYLTAITFETAPSGFRKPLFGLSVAANLGILTLFRLPNFAGSNITLLAQALCWNYSSQALSLIVPIGLSFQIFQGLSYLIEVYNGRYKAETHPGIYLASVAFFPVVLAGPIERPQNLLSQFRDSHTFDYQRVAGGLRRMAWGFFKKVVIADRLAGPVNIVYGHPRDYPDFMLPVVILFFAYQIYADFSGYTDIVIGAAQVMGFRLTENFNRPYASSSFTEFWQRWHISLSSWIRDYLYMPLARRAIRVAKGKVLEPVRLLISIAVMSLIGLWHGASLTFFAWGAIHGAALGVEGLVRAITPRRAPVSSVWNKLWKLIKAGVVFAFICMAWVFFAAHTMEDALYILPHLFSGIAQFFGGGVTQRLLQSTFLLLGYDRTTFIAVAIAIIVMEAVQLVQTHNELIQRFSLLPAWVRWLLYYLLLLYVLFFGAFKASPFIYFQF